MTRKQALACIRVAGFHDDSAAFTRLYLENRVSLVAARQAFQDGRAAEANGARCSCCDCAAAPTTIGRR